MHGHKWTQKVWPEMALFLLVPVFFALIEGREHDGHNCGCIVTDKAYDVFIIPKVQRPLSHLYPISKLTGNENIITKTKLK